MRIDGTVVRMVVRGAAIGCMAILAPIMLDARGARIQSAQAGGNCTLTNQNWCHEGTETYQQYTCGDGSECDSCCWQFDQSCSFGGIHNAQEYPNGCPVS